MVGNGPRDAGHMITAHTVRRRSERLRASIKSVADSEAAFMPEHMSGCSGKISLPSGRSMDLQIHHHVRHTFRDIQVLPESLLRIAGMHAMTCRQNLLWNRKVSISSPPHCRTYDSQHASGRISVLHPSRFPRDAYSWSCTAENTARFRRAENTRTHLTSGIRTVRFRHGVENGLLPFRPPFGGNHMHQYCVVSAHAADLRLFRQGSAPFYRAAYVNR